MPRVNPEIRALREKLPEYVSPHGYIWGQLTPAQIEQLEKASEFSDFKRVDNERQLETLKNHLASHIYDPNKGFDKMIMATKYYLEAMDIQNKMWGIYTMTHRSIRLIDQNGEPPPPTQTTNIDIKAVVLELQKIARGAPLKQVDDAK
jgi:hypothetical protein